jgi:hypothetical protein
MLGRSTVCTVLELTGATEIVDGIGDSAGAARLVGAGTAGTMAAESAAAD